MMCVYYFSLCVYIKTKLVVKNYSGPMKYLNELLNSTEMIWLKICSWNFFSYIQTRKGQMNWTSLRIIFQMKLHMNFKCLITIYHYPVPRNIAMNVKCPVSKYHITIRRFWNLIPFGQCFLRSLHNWDSLNE